MGKAIQAVMLIGLIMIVGFGGYWMYNYFSTQPQAGVSGACAYGGVWPACNAPPAGAPYAGTVTMTLSALWALDETTYTYTNDPVVKVYHADKSLAPPAMTLTSHLFVATDVTENPTDKGVMFLAIASHASGDAFVDPILTKKNNPSYISDYFTQDLNKDNKEELVFTLNLAAITQAGNTGKANVQISLYVWKPDTSGIAVTSSTNPSLVGATGGDIQTTGYITMTGEGYEAKLVRLLIWASDSGAANTTMGAYFLASSVYVSEFRLSGVGQDSGYTYGAVWTGLSGLYDTANTRYVVYSASKNGVTDISQPEWGMPFVYEDDASSSWLTWNMGIHANAGAFGAGTYHMYIQMLIANSYGTATTKGLKTTITVT